MALTLVPLRLPDEDRKALQTLAEEGGVSFSKLVRNMVHEYANDPSAITKALEMRVKVTMSHQPAQEAHQ